jgi:hypothetical protein
MHDSSPKVVGVGFHKTGTTTLREALKILGYRVADNKPGLLIPILKKRYDYVMRRLDPYQACEDLPWNRLYPVIDQYFDNTKFILTVRDAEAWYASVSHHIGDLRSPMHEWLYGRGKGLPKEDKAHALKVYQDHNQAVKTYFKDRPEDLLEIDLAREKEPWQKLCHFLNLPVPDEPFPHYNNTALGNTKQKPRWQKAVKKARKRLKCGIKNRYIDWKGLW